MFENVRIANLFVERLKKMGKDYNLIETNVYLHAPVSTSNWHNRWDINHERAKHFAIEMMISF